MAPILHTPLESFLLFQTLHPFGKEPYIPSFGTISESLKKNDLIRESNSFDAGRLEPDSLKDLYLLLLKEEAKREVASRNENGQGTQPNPRKRKLASPLLETVDEAAHYGHLLPHLVTRLYLRYRDNAVKSIKHEEDRYRSLQKDIQEIGRERASRHSSPTSQGVPSIQNLLRQTEDSARPPLEPSDGLRNGQHRPVPIGAPQGILSNAEAQASIHDVRNIHADIYKSGSQPGSAENGVPFLPPPQHPPHAYQLPSSAAEPHRKNSSHHHAAPSQSPRVNQATLPPPERSSASPIILPPPPGMLRSSGSPTGPLDVLADTAGQQYRPNTSIQSPRQPQYAAPRQHPSQLAHPRNHAQQQYSAYYDNHPYPAPYQPYNQGPMPIYHPHAGSMQPYTPSGQNSSHGSPFGGTAYQSPLAPQHAAYYPPQPPYPPPVQTPYAQHPPRYLDQRAPIPNPSPKLRQERPSPIVTSTSSTKWKKFDRTGSGASPGSPVRPRSRSISPLSDKAISPEPEESATRAKRTRSNKNKQAEEKVATPELAGNRRKGSKTRESQARRGRGGRAGSIASTAADSNRARSQSVADELSEPAIPSKKIKPEPPVSTHEVSPSAASITADNTIRPKRRRRGTFAVEANSPTRPPTKRQRVDALTSTGFASSPTPAADTKPGHILGTRNFPRISQALINEITSHRLASLFAKPLTEREAPGYRSLVHRPQDLKSIKAAIAAGSKALNAYAADSNAESASMGGNGVNIWIPASEDVVPPKGIVNAMQLEKELIRVFANAVMFNPDIATNRGLGPAFNTRRRHRSHLPSNLRGETPSVEEAEGSPDGIKAEIGVAAPVEGAVVTDTRNVCRDVEVSFANWRAVERAAEETHSAGTPAGKGAAGRLRGVAATESDGGVDEESEAPDELAEEVVPSVEESEPRAKRRRRA